MFISARKKSIRIALILMKIVSAVNYEKLFKMVLIVRVFLAFFKLLIFPIFNDLLSNTNEESFLCKVFEYFFLKLGANSYHPSQPRL